MDGERITSRPGGGVQVAGTGRKLFGKGRQTVFLEHLAATCNVARAAAAAGVTAQCVYRRRMTDAAFREGWGRALEQGFARLEASLLERAAAPEAPVAVRGDLALAEEPWDKDLALHLWREHRKGLAGVPRGPEHRRKAADWSEVEAYFVARLKALRRRLPASPADETKTGPA